ncbi:hypothetical protein BU26DRAFT_155781 [Trematosphaeria pertusa]|uniref:Uncharacterized protein n=1 Tax=Trematosphaeria pertusa TaxID=390896 RepID=A0A6A6IZC5_9PLEO|nr:uncharacterized protein BU26DRAFT_155781 [Trematosphaeria pertusa]KAF2255417.1 hypothetical protein BU26DRAFT_155781 [Trematosphaeria pertusa]
MSNSPPRSPGARRRASVTGETFQGLFGGRQNSVGGQGGAQPYPGPITSAAVNAQRRRLSLTTLGLSGSPSQTSPFQSARPRTESLSSANSGSVDESPFEDDPAPSASSSSSNPATPFARRLSFGARALRDVRQSNGSVGNPNGRPSIHKASSPPTTRGRGLSSSSPSFPSPLPILVPPASPSSLHSERSASLPSSDLSHVLAEYYKRHPDQAFGEHELTTMLSHTGEGYNFAENLRSRAERTSMSSAHPIHSPQAPPHQRAKSVAIMEPPAREMPKQPKVPDAMQERILKGDFYMD